MAESGPHVRRLYTPEGHKTKTSCDVETAWRCTSLPLPPGNSIVCWAGLAGKHGLSSASMAVRADPYFCPAFGVDNHED